MLTIKIDEWDQASITYELAEAEAISLGNRLVASPPASLRLVECYDDAVFLETRGRSPWGHLTVEVGCLYGRAAGEPNRHGIRVEIGVRRETLDYTTQLKTLDLTTHLTTAAVLRTLLAA